jgi:hypothetical protein
MVGWLQLQYDIPHIYYSAYEYQYYQSQSLCLCVYICAVCVYYIVFWEVVIAPTCFLRLKYDGLYMLWFTLQLLHATPAIDLTTHHLFL